MASSPSINGSRHDVIVIGGGQAGLAMGYQLAQRGISRLTRNNDGFALTTNQGTLEAKQVVVAMSTFQQPRVPAFAAEFALDITQLTSFAYRSPAQLREGAALVVGAGNSGAEIALDLAKTHRVILSGRDVGQVPFRITSPIARVLMPAILRIGFHRVLTIRTPMGRKMRPKLLTSGAPLVRTKREDLTAAGVDRVGRVAGVRDGKPLLDDGRVLDVSNVIWCTGLEPGFSWIDIDVHGDLEPRHEGGVVPDVPGLYFLGLMFLYAGSSVMVHGVSRDAARLANVIAQSKAS